MRIHTDKITWQQVREAGVLARVTFTKIKEHGSKSRDHSFDVVLSGASKHRQNMGGEGYAATWDQWGVFLAELFRSDPNLLCRNYRDVADFDYKTGLPPSDKDVEGFAAELSPLGPTVLVTHAPSPRALSPEDLLVA